MAHSDPRIEAAGRALCAWTMGPQPYEDHPDVWNEGAMYAINAYNAISSSQQRRLDVQNPNDRHIEYQED